MRKIAIIIGLVLLAGCGPTQGPVQNEFLLNLERTQDFQLAQTGEEINISDGVFFRLEKADIVFTIPNVDKDSPFENIYSKDGGFLVCEAEIWKTKPEAQFPKFDMISVIPSFGTQTTDQFIITHAQLAYGLPMFDQTKVNETKQKFLFVYEIYTEQVGWTFNFYKTENAKLKLYRMVDTGR